MECLPSLASHCCIEDVGAGIEASLKLAALFSVDSFAGGLVVNSLLALWIFQKFDLSLSAAGAFFFASGLLGAVSQLAAPKLAKRIGLVNTMVFTHIPASLCLIAAAFCANVYLALGLLLMRSLVSSMDVPAQSAFVMSVVLPHERAAAGNGVSTSSPVGSARLPSIAVRRAAPIAVADATSMMDSLSCPRYLASLEPNVFRSIAIDVPHGRAGASC